MTMHTAKTVPVAGSDRHYAKCSCRWQPFESFPNAQAAEDAIFKHLKEVERARAGLRTRTPALKSERDWYRQQAEDPSNPEEERALWLQLADELDRRLNDADSPDEGQLRLL